MTQPTFTPDHAKLRILTLKQNKQASALSVSPSTAAITAAQTATKTSQLTATVTSNAGTSLSAPTVTWASSDETVATVGASTGLVTGVAAGTATITASCVTTLNGTLAATSAITVTDPLLVLTPTSRTFTAVHSGSNPATQTVAISNGGNGTIAPVVGTITYDEGSGWAAATYASLTGLVTITCTVGALTAATYHAHVPITSTNASNTPQSIGITFTVT